MHEVRVCRESNPDRPIHSAVRYLYATEADQSLNPDYEV